MHRVYPVLVLMEESLQSRYSQTRSLLGDDLTRLGLAETEKIKRVIIFSVLNVIIIIILISCYQKNTYIYL